MNGAVLPQRQLFGPSIDETFEQFHRAHPHVYQRLVEMARALKRAGHRGYGIKSLFEVLRYEADTQAVDGATGYKLNNNYTSRYARMIHTMEPDLNGFFRTRGLRTP